jgi:putative tricarboxylic transport membrane protein
MEPRSTKDLASGIALAAFGIYVTLAAARLNYISEEGPGPGFLPLWLGIAVCVLASCLLITNQLRPPSSERNSLRAPGSEKRAIGGWLVLMSAIALFPLIGFTICLALLTIFFIAVMERRSPYLAVLIALALAVGFHLIFVTALGLSLPQSPLGF